MPEVRAARAGDNIELVAALAQQLTDGLRGVLGKLPCHHRALQQQTQHLQSDIAKAPKHQHLSSQSCITGWLWITLDTSRATSTDIVSDKTRCAHHISLE